MKMVYHGVNPKTNRLEWLDEDAGIIMEEWQMIQYRPLVEDIEKYTGRTLTKEETHTIHWLSGWEQVSIHRIRNIILDAFLHGKKIK
jgi:hypothetical protein